MCTVTYYPVGSSGYILTSNRDEKVIRALAEPPRGYCLHGQLVLFPKDPQGDGTWIAMSDKKRSLCLLNGAFHAHISTPPYRRSRGLVLLDCLNYVSVTEFVAGYDFTNIEPFTLLVIQTEFERSLLEIRWDGREVHMSAKDPSQPHIWSSATLYSPAIQKEREQWYAQFLRENSVPDTGSLLRFHKFTANDDPVNGLLINRDDNLKTVSVTSVSVSDMGDYVMTYEDLVRETEQSYRIF